MSELQDQLQEILGPNYRIDRELGGGGMSRVFVATETELEREVVVKVLPPELAAGLNNDRFRREIQLAARLQHPHIVPLLSAGAKASLLYYTMPFIAGENLRTRLNKSGELPVQEATRILREVADALSYAHSQGVVHRDMKPENILISGSHALVTDFGVAKALSSATSESPTDPAALTSLGVALGTPAYMAPEQAAADPLVDARADIYALGIVGYELLSGRTPFSGLNQQQTLAAHITTDPAPVSQHRPQIPAGLAQVIMKAIEKRPSDRWQSAQELHDALEPYSMTSGAILPSRAVRSPFRWTSQRIAVAAGILGLVVTGLIASTIAFRRNSDALIVGNTRQVTSADGLEILPRISPDGKLVAYTVPSGDANSVYVKQLSGGRAIMVADTGWFPTWKPDGSGILYTRPGEEPGSFITASVPSLGGVSTPVSGLENLAACAYSNAGDQVTCVDVKTQGLVVAGANGENRHVIAGTSSSDGVTLPSWSPDDKLIAFSKGNQNFFIGADIGNIAPSSVWVVNAINGTPVRISDETHLNVSPAWTPDGALLYVSSRGGNRDIYLQRLGGGPSKRGEPVRLTTGLNAHTISIDKEGKTLAYSVFSTVANVYSALIASSDPVNPPVSAVTTGNQTVEGMSISPDGKWLAYDSNINGNQDIFKMPLGGGEPQQLTHNGVDNFLPSWSPDGRQIAFHRLVNGNRDVYVMDASGGNAVPVAATAGQELAGIWRPDNKGIVYRQYPNSLFEILRDPTTRSGWGKPRYLGDAILGGMSPDGKEVILGNPKPPLCTKCPDGGYVFSQDWTNPRAITFTSQFLNVIAIPGNVVWTKDAKHAFLWARERDGTSSIWQIPINGDAERRVFHLTDPKRRFYNLSLHTDATRFYFNLGDRQSDIWTMELTKQ